MYGISGFSNPFMPTYNDPFFSGTMLGMPNQSYGHGGNQYNIGHNSGLIIGENSGPLSNNSNIFAFGSPMGMPQMGGCGDPYGIFGGRCDPYGSIYGDPYGIFGGSFGGRMGYPSMGGSNQSNIGLNNGVAVGTNNGYIDNRQMSGIPKEILWGHLLLDVYREYNRNQAG
ncbi:MAG: hypothetical protein ACD_20C00148G0011 [uncultured bacterium]|nr:MAG: hypothetical protein ACD_20C00148G0011 [uncultured bacterium]HBH17778.1 hypothetical protein [Cyanobacteria bacterium UBA9579]